MIEAMQNFAAGFPEWLQWLGVLLASAVPFVESYFGAIIGVFIGLPPVIAILVAVIGNIASMALVVCGAASTRDWITARRRRKQALRPGAATADLPDEELDSRTARRRQRVQRMLNRWGVPGVSLLGQTILPSQITSLTMVSLGASRNVVLVWQVVSIVLWGTLFGTLAALGVNLLAP